MVVTDHSAYDWGVVREKTKLLVDTRRVVRDELANRKVEVIG